VGIQDPPYHQAGSTLDGVVIAGIGRYPKNNGFPKNLTKKTQNEQNPCT